MYEDSQRTDSQETLFGSPVNAGSPSRPRSSHEQGRSSSTANCHACAENTRLLTEVLKEVNELKELVKEQRNCSSCASQTGYKVESSVLEAKVVSLTQKQAVRQDIAVVLRAVRKFAARKFVDYRAQVKSKLLSDIQDLGLLGLSELSKKLFGKFTSSYSDQNVLQTTIMLRSYCHENKLLKKLRPGNTSCPPQPDFWKGFQALKARIDVDEDPLKLEKMQVREEKRIEHYQK